MLTLEMGADRECLMNPHPSPLATTNPVDRASQDTAGNPAHRPGLPHHESAEGYRRIVARLNAGWRVILCRVGIQWILQRRDAGRSQGAGWRGIRYHTTRDHLIAAAGALCGRIDPAMVAVLAALPDHVSGVVR